MSVYAGQNGKKKVRYWFDECEGSTYEEVTLGAPLGLVGSALAEGDDLLSLSSGLLGLCYSSSDSLMLEKRRYQVTVQ